MKHKLLQEKFNKKTVIKCMYEINFEGKESTNKHRLR